MAESIFNQGLLDFENLKTLRIDHYSENAEISWNETLMFRAAKYGGKDCTIILDHQGQITLVNRPLRKTIENFSRRMRISGFEVQCYAGYLNFSYYVPCARRKYGMFRLRGSDTEDNIWVMRHKVDQYSALKEDGMLCVSFKEGQHAKIRMDEKSFQKRMDAVDKVRETQDAFMKQKLIAFGYQKYENLGGEYQLEHSYLQTNPYQMCDFYKHVAIDIVDHVLQRRYESSVTDEDRALIKQLLGKPFRGWSR